VLNGVRKLPPATVRVYEPDGRTREHRYWAPPYERQPEHAGWSAQDWEQAVLDALRVSVKAPHGLRHRGRRAAVRRRRLLARRRPARRAGQQGLRTFSIGFEPVGGRSGDEFVYSDLIADRFGTNHTRMMVPPERVLPALDDAVRAMSEPMVSHDVVAFYLLSQEVARHVTSCSRGRAPTRCSPATTGTRRCWTRRIRSARTCRASSTAATTR
jgi:asparagine synthase (glutamine-hydrolysing)